MPERDDSEFRLTLPKELIGKIRAQLFQRYQNLLNDAVSGIAWDLVEQGLLDELCDQDTKLPVFYQALRTYVRHELQQVSCDHVIFQAALSRNVDPMSSAFSDTLVGLRGEIVAAISRCLDAVARLPVVTEPKLQQPAPAE